MKRIALVLGLTLLFGGVPLTLRAQEKEDDFLFEDPDVLSAEDQAQLREKLSGKNSPSARPPQRDRAPQGKPTDDPLTDTTDPVTDGVQEAGKPDDSIPGMDEADELIEQPLEEVLAADVLDAEEATPEPEDPAERERIQRGVEELQQKAEEYKARLEDPTPVTEAEVAAATADRERAAEEAKSLASEVTAVGGGEAPEPPVRGYTAPVLEPVPSHDDGGDSWRSSGRALGGVNGGLASEEDAPGAENHSFFEKLLGAVLQGTMQGLQLGAEAYRRRLANERVNELKALADRLALSSREAHRPYVDENVRRALSASGLGKRGYDQRLDDLILGGNRTPLQPTPPSGGSTPPPARVGDASLGAGSSPARTVPRLPRVRDPITGTTRVVVDMPLGAAPTVPLGPR